MRSADMAATLHQRMHGVLLRFGLSFVDVLFLAADERLIAFHDLAFAANPAGAHLRQLHCLADAHANEPSGAVAA